MIISGSSLQSLDVRFAYHNVIIQVKCHPRIGRQVESPNDVHGINGLRVLVQTKTIEGK